MATKIKIAAAMAVLTVFIPLAAFARTTTPVTTQSSFCSNLSAISAQFTSKLTNDQQGLADKQQQIQAELQNREKQRAQNLAGLRSQDDQQRQSAYTQLMNKAQTDAQKQAVTNFESSINAAISARRTAIDAALQTYWTGLANLLGSRKSTVLAAEQKFLDSVTVALTAARTACNSGTPPTTVKQQFIIALKTARAQFATDRKTIDKLGPQIKVLVQTRNAAVKQAQTEFKTAAEQARAALKAAFGQSNTATSTPNQE